MNNKKVVVYSTPTCMYCRLAKEFFNDNKVPYTEHDVASDVAARKVMMEKSGQSGVPVIMVDDEVIVGFDEDTLRELLAL